MIHQRAREADYYGFRAFFVSQDGGHSSFVKTVEDHLKWAIDFGVKYKASRSTTARTPSLDY